MSQENTRPRISFHFSAIPFQLLIVWILAFAFFVIFLFLGIDAIRVLARMSALKNEGIVSHGEIIAWQYRYRREGRHSRPWKPTVVFVDQSGQKHTYECSHGYRNRSGQSTSVFYARDNPENVATREEIEYHIKMMPVLIALSSLIVIVTGFGCVTSLKYLRIEYERNLPKRERWRRRKRKRQDHTATRKHL